MFFWRSRYSNWLQTILENWNKLLETFHWHQHLQWTWASKSLNLLNLFQLILEDVFPCAETPPIWKLVTSLRCWTATFHHSNIPLGDSLGSLFRRALPWHGFLPCSWFLCLDMQVDLGWRLVRALKELTFLCGRLVLLREIFTHLQLQENSDIIYCHMIWDFFNDLNW